MQSDRSQNHAGPAHWPLAGTVRRPPASTGSFGHLTFACGLVLRRSDDTVVVQVDLPDPPGDVIARFRAVGVAQLAFDRTLCRAQAVGWDTALHAVIFELHRPVFPEVGTPADDVAQAA